MAQAWQVALRRRCAAVRTNVREGKVNRPLTPNQLSCLWLAAANWVAMSGPRNDTRNRLVRRGLMRLKRECAYYPTTDGWVVGAYVQHLNGRRISKWAHREIVRRRPWLTQLVRPEAARRAGALLQAQWNPGKTFLCPAPNCSQPSKFRRWIPERARRNESGLCWVVMTCTRAEGDDEQN